MMTNKAILAIINTSSGQMNPLIPQILIPFAKAVRRTG